MSLSQLPLHPGFKPRRNDESYRGDIHPFQVFAWEPFLPHASEFVIVTRITGPADDRQVWCKSIADSAVSWGVSNDEDRFREAVYETQFNDMWTPTPNDPGPHYPNCSHLFKCSQP